jgi:hypothetical protein
MVCRCWHRSRHRRHVRIIPEIVPNMIPGSHTQKMIPIIPPVLILGWVSFAWWWWFTNRTTRQSKLVKVMVTITSYMLIHPFVQRLLMLEEVIMVLVSAAVLFESPSPQRMARRIEEE